jgi:hypothetical protein
MPTSFGVTVALVVPWLVVRRIAYLTALSAVASDPALIS